MTVFEIKLYQRYYFDKHCLGSKILSRIPDQLCVAPRSLLLVFQHDY